VVRVPLRESVSVLGESVRHPHALAVDHDVVEALGIEPHERYAIGDVERAEEIVDALALAAVEEVVDLRAEAKITDAEGVRVAARLVVGLEHQDAAPRSREHRADGEPAHSRSDHDVVVVGHSPAIGERVREFADAKRPHVTLRRKGYSLVREREPARTAVGIRGAQLLDHEAGGLELSALREGDDSCRRWLLERRGPALPPTCPSTGRGAVFDEEEPPAGPEHAADLSEARATSVSSNHR
jgi:hypothetical protein